MNELLLWALIGIGLFDLSVATLLLTATSSLNTSKEKNK